MVEVFKDTIVQWLYTVCTAQCVLHTVTVWRTVYVQECTQLSLLKYQNALLFLVKNKFTMFRTILK